jgi:hypothetical protein
VRASPILGSGPRTSLPSASGATVSPFVPCCDGPLTRTHARSAVAKGGILAFINSVEIEPYSAERTLREDHARLQKDLKEARSSARALAGVNRTLTSQTLDLTTQLAKQEELVAQLQSALTEASASQARLQYIVDQLQQPLSLSDVDLAAARENIASKVRELNQSIGDTVSSMLVVVTSFGASKGFPSGFRSQPGSTALLHKLYQAAPNSKAWQALLKASLRDAILVQLNLKIFSSPTAVFTSPSLRRVWGQAKHSCGE